MVAILLFVGAILFASSMIFMHSGTAKVVWVTVGLVLTLGSIVLIILNYNQYLGMKQVTTTTTVPLTSSSPTQKQVLLYRQLGTKNERVYLYRTNPLDKTMKRTNPATGKVIVKHGARYNRLVIKKTYRVYRNEEYRLLFSAGVTNHQFISQTWQFNLQSGWLVKPV